MVTDSDAVARLIGEARFTGIVTAIRDALVWPLRQVIADSLSNADSRIP